MVLESIRKYGRVFGHKLNQEGIPSALKYAISVPFCCSVYNFTESLDLLQLGEYYESGAMVFNEGDFVLDKRNVYGEAIHIPSLHTLENRVEDYDRRYEETLQTGNWSPAKHH